MRKFTTVLIMFMQLTAVCIANEQDQELSDLYTQYAISAYKSGDYEYAIKLADKAVIFDGDNADALYLKAILIRDLPGRAPEYADLLDKSVTKNEFRYYTKEEVYYNYCLINKRLKHYGAIIRLMDKLDRTLLFTRADFIYLYADALTRNGNREKAIKILKESVRYFHDDTDLWKLLIELDKTELKSVRSQLLFHSKTELYPLYDPILRMTTDTRQKELLIEKYYSYGPGTWQMKIRSYLLYPRISWYEIRDVLSERLPESRYEADLLYRLAAKNDLLIDFSDFWRKFSGVLQNDSNQDGFSDSIEEFEQGRLKQAIFDSDQNGDPESIVILKGDKVRLVFQQDIMQEITYGVYPFVDSVKQYSDPYTVREYVMRPGHLKADLIEINEGLVTEVSMKGKALDPDTFMDKVLYVNTMQAEKGIMERSYTYFPFGIAEEFIYGNSQVLSKTFYTDGKAVKSEYDNDLDGYAESIIVYSGGKAKDILSDLNHNGVYEYKESLSDNTKKYWDLNEDGVYDVCEYKVLNDIVREFSSDLDGAFDVSLHVRKGNIIGIYRSGVKQNLSVDKYGQFWIGKAGNIFIPEKTEGIFFNGNKQYYIFNYNGRRYIEGMN